MIQLTIMKDDMNTLLDHKEIMRSIEALFVRIQERFPDSVLVSTCSSLRHISMRYDEDVRKINEPNMIARIGSGIFIAVAVMALIYAVTSMETGMREFSFVDIIELADAALNELFIIGATILFIVSLESRLKHNRIIGVVNKLRSLAHVIDMHQLTKDHTIVTGKVTRTQHSPKRTMTSYELSRYLDYCSEMLSLTGKLGFSYVQYFDDAESVRAVNELENLTTGLSRKIWQKTMLIQAE